MRNRLGGSFDQECTVFTLGSPVSDGAGGSTPGLPTELDRVPCEVRFPKSNPQNPLNQATDTTLSRAEIRLPVDTTVSVDSTITVGPVAYKVKGHDVGRSFASEILCDCVRQDDGQPSP